MEVGNKERGQTFIKYKGENANVGGSETQPSSCLPLGDKTRLDLVLVVRIHHSTAQCLRMR